MPVEMKTPLMTSKFLDYTRKSAEATSEAVQPSIGQVAKEAHAKYITDHKSELETALNMRDYEDMVRMLNMHSDRAWEAAAEAVYCFAIQQATHRIIESLAKTADAKPIKA